jgi:hypothetical protein
MGYSVFDDHVMPAWNAGRKLGPKRALKQKEVWAIRFGLEQEGRRRDRALFDLAIDSKLGGCRCAKIDDECFPNTLPISFSPSPRCQRSHISALSDALNRRIRLIVHLTSSKVKCCDDQLNPRS